MSRRFGPGERYVSTTGGNEDDPTAEARDLFVEIAAAVAPKLVHSFCSNVAPHLEVLWFRHREEQSRNPAAVFNVWTTALGLQPAGFSPGGATRLDLTALIRAEPDHWLSRLAVSLSAWEEAWNLSSNRWFAWRMVHRSHTAWLIANGLYRAQAGHPDPKLAAALWKLWIPLGSWKPIEAPGPAVELPGWDPTRSTWGEYRRWIEDVVLPSALERHRTLGASLERSPVKENPERDLRWLVHWQINGLTHRAILDDPETSDDIREKGEVETVRKAVERASTLVGLTRRTETS